MKYFFCLFFLFCFNQMFAGDTADIIIRHGKIVDGTGNPWFYGDIAIRNEKIVSVGNLNNWFASKTIDATDLVVAPGFIDVHTHIENDEAKNPYATNFIMDGVTTVITGNCGSSNVDIKKYLSFIDSLHLSINVATLIGHNDVREAVMGDANRAPTTEELNRMKSLVAQGMHDGAVGFPPVLFISPVLTQTQMKLLSWQKLLRNITVYIQHTCAMKVTA